MPPAAIPPKSHLESRFKTKRICRSVDVRDLANFDGEIETLKPHKELPKAPKSGVWTLFLGEPAKNHIGLQNWKTSFSKGSARAQSQTYPRIAFPSVPRSGNHWFRDLWESATRLTTGTVFEQHTGNKHLDTMWDEHCSAHLRVPEGTRKFPNCNGGQPILVKSHTPFQALMRKDYKYDADFSNISFVMHLVRNPIDNWDAWDRFYAPRKIPIQEFAYLWAAHHQFWEQFNVVPRFVLRYEDMLLDIRKTFKEALAAAPGVSSISGDFEKALKTNAPSKSFDKKCGVAISRLSHQELEWLRQYFGHVMEAYGYKLKFSLGKE